MKTAFMNTAFAGLCFVALAAHAEPRAGSVEECLAYADLALVASALAKHGVKRDKTESVLPDIYDLKHPDAQALTRQIVAAAYREDNRGEPRAFASRLGNACMRHGGSMVSVLGTRL